MKLRDVLCQPDYGGDLYPYGFVVCEDPKCVEGGENYENGNETGRSVQANDRFSGKKRSDLFIPINQS